jgi:16S rRNA (guanine966-N2)-methyltransferase
MRIVGGQWKGRPLVAPAGRVTRPTSDKVREAVFAVLGALAQVRAVGDASPASGPLAGHVVLDLFAGSGALGIEALSRGAGSCTFVEKDRQALRAVRANLERLEVTTDGAVADPGGERGADACADRRVPSAPRARVLAADVRRALQADARLGARYTLVFADPPYDRYADVRPALVRLLGPVLAPQAVLVVETAAGVTAGLPWTVVREKRYGDTRVTFLVAKDAQQAEGATAEDH